MNNNGEKEMETQQIDKEDSKELDFGYKSIISEKKVSMRKLSC